MGGRADGSNASAARRAAGEALAVAALRIQGERKHGRGTPLLTTLPSEGLVLAPLRLPAGELPSAFEALF